MSYVNERAKQIINLLDAEDQKIMREYMDNYISEGVRESKIFSITITTIIVLVTLSIASCYGYPVLHDSMYSERAWKNYADSVQVERDLYMEKSRSCVDELDLWKKLREKQCVSGIQ